MNYAIEMEGLAKIFHNRWSKREVRAVDGISLRVEPGTAFGLLGPNGAGKTTTLSAIEGLVKPQSGTVSVMGHDVGRETETVKRMLGISLQSTAFFDTLRVWELVRLYAGMYEVMLDKAQVIELLTRFELQDKANAQAEQLSGGQQQRLALVLALANDPQIVVLDEPTTGLDPQARRSVWDSIRDIQSEGRTVLLTTHYMEEAEELCSRIAIIDNGEIIALNTPAGLTNSIHADGRITTTAKLPEADVCELPSVTGVRYEGGRLVIHFYSEGETAFALQTLAVSRKMVLTDLSIKQADLEDVFIALTGRKIR